jgi:hypothetical protein
VVNFLGSPLRGVQTPLYYYCSGRKADQKNVLSIAPIAIKDYTNLTNSRSTSMTEFMD